MAKTNNNQKKGGSLKLKMSHAKLHLELEPAVRLIGEATGIKDVDTTLNIVKTRKNIDAIMETFQKTRQKLVEELAEKHEDGKPVTRKTVQRHPLTGIEQEVMVLVYKDDETQRLANAKAQELDAKEIQVEVFPIEYKNIKEAKFGSVEGVPPNILVAAGDFVIIE